MVDVGPFRVMIHRPGLEPAAHHEGHRAAEVGELEFLREGIVRETPTGQAGKRGVNISSRQWLGHVGRLGRRHQSASAAPGATTCANTGYFPETGRGLSPRRG